MCDSEKEIIYLGQLFNNGPCKICGTQSLKNLKRYSLSKAERYLERYFLLQVFPQKIYKFHTKY